MIVIRLIAAVIVSAALALGAGWGLSNLLGAPAAPAAEAPDTDTEAAPEHGEGEPPLALPYEADGAAAFLADALAGTGAVEPASSCFGGDAPGGPVDLAAQAAEAAQPQPAILDDGAAQTRTASCEASHVRLVCTISTAWVFDDGVDTTESAEWYQFQVEQSEAGWALVPGSLSWCAAG
ncbi:MAG: hypothetical protein ABL308_02875 [Oceanicaulis sp.]